jgi:hypothetical protein
VGKLLFSKVKVLVVLRCGEKKGGGNTRRRTD